LLAVYTDADKISANYFCRQRIFFARKNKKGGWGDEAQPPRTNKEDIFSCSAITLSNQPAPVNAAFQLRVTRPQFAPRDFIRSLSAP
jgi:hypothetical protein